MLENGNEKEEGLSPLQIVFLFGLISLIADAVYEGARGIIPNYLKTLGATALLVGTILGAAEFIGYLFRIVSGTLTDRWKNPWPFVLLGYGVLVVIPLLAVTGHWMAALVLLLIERVGKSIRGPARDTILSSTISTKHAGKAFGLHELMDQLGAILGPLLAVIILFQSNDDYRLAFLGFTIPYGILLLVLIITYLRLRTPVDQAIRIEAKSDTSSLHDDNVDGFSHSFYLYGVVIFLNIMGLVHFSIILLMVGEIAVTMAWLAAAVYLLIQAVDAFTAPVWGTLFDRFHLSIMIFPPLIAILPSLFLLSPSLNSLILAAAFFGIVLAAQESIYRAGIAHLIPISKRGTAYGYLYVMMGLGSLLSGVIFGYLLDLQLFPFMVMFSIILQISSLLVLFLLIKKTSR